MTERKYQGYFFITCIIKGGWGWGVGFSAALLINPRDISAFPLFWIDLSFFSTMQTLENRLEPEQPVLKLRRILHDAFVIETCTFHNHTFFWKPLNSTCYPWSSDLDLLSLTCWFSWGAWGLHKAQVFFEKSCVCAVFQHITCPGRRCVKAHESEHISSRRNSNTEAPCGLLSTTSLHFLSPTPHSGRVNCVVMLYIFLLFGRQKSYKPCASWFCLTSRGWLRGEWGPAYTGGSVGSRVCLRTPWSDWFIFLSFNSIQSEGAIFWSHILSTPPPPPPPL